jgi:hypothetical protein
MLLKNPGYSALRTEIAAVVPDFQIRKSVVIQAAFYIITA